MHLTLPDASAPGAPDPKKAALNELERILASSAFARAERMRRFLRYTVEQTLGGDLERLKETVIGVEVFDRSPDYDPKTDPIVRIEARRLREKLTQYYQAQGKDSGIRIELPKSGYVASFVIPAPPSVSEPEPGTEKPVVEATPVPVPGPGMPVVRDPWRLIAACAVAVVLLAVALLLDRTRFSTETPPPTVRTLTRLPGPETDPRFSPDGTKVAYVWTGGEQGSPNLYVQAIDSFTPVQLTTEGQVSRPAWSPDGKEIAFLRALGGDRFGIFTVDLATRAVRRRAEVNSDPFPVGLAIHLDWSPDGQFFLTTHRGNLSLIAAGSGEMTQLTTAPERALGDYDGVFSPDGRRVAFRRAVSFGVSDLWITPVQGQGQPARLTYENQTFRGHTWTDNGKTIVFARNQSLWRIPSGGGQATRITDGTVSAMRPAAAGGDGRLVFMSPTERSRIWRMPLDRPGPLRPILSSTVADASPDLSPDGGRIAFRSNRSGSSEIWVAGADGSNPVRLTHFDGPLTGCPRWSPDGKYIAFDSRPEGESDIYILNPATGAVQRFTSGSSDKVVPSWSRDGRFLYFASNRTGEWQVWKQPVAGGDATQVTTGGGFAAWESHDGRVLYYVKDRSGSGLWTIPVDGGEERAVIEELERGMWGNWQLGRGQVVFAEAAPPYRVRLVDLKTMRHTDAGRLGLPPLIGDAGMALSPDGKWLYVALAEPPASDIFLMERSD